MIAIDDARAALLRKRTSLLRRSHALKDGQRELLEERETDVPDIASGRTAAELLAHLDDAETLQVERINEALERIEVGDYGTCAVCGEEIPEARLAAVPETDRCAECTNSH